MPYIGSAQKKHNMEIPLILIDLLFSGPEGKVPTDHDT